VISIAVISDDLLLECTAVFGHAKPPKLGVQLSGVSSEARAVSGWLVTPGTFVLHSVVRQRGALICVTPAETGHEDWIDFIPDPALMRSKTPAGQYIFQRGSHPISYGLRYDPEFVEGLWDLTRKNLDAGKSAQVIATESMRYMRENWMSP
jgi:hypothetical protein